MKKKYYYLALIMLLLSLVNTLKSQHYYDDEFTAQKADNYSIDGIANEAFWESCEWYDMQYIWIPFGEAMTDGDFSGRVKFAWTDTKLLVFAEIEDDVLSDTHDDPFDNYWNDDCFELFIDEDYSGGWHQNDNNAFAYHCAINEVDVIDMAGNLKNHVEFDLDTVDATHYVWELAFTIYDDSYDHSSATNNTVTLSENKEIGIAVAYCDNDGGNERENFIGLIDVNEEHYNSAWQDASVFGKLTLSGSNTNSIKNTNITNDIIISQYLNSNLIIRNSGKQNVKANISIVDINGRLLKETIAILGNETMLNVGNLKNGCYFVNVKGNGFNTSKALIKQ